MSEEKKLKPNRMSSGVSMTITSNGETVPLVPVSKQVEPKESKESESKAK
jgi:antitoxin (DNA-binding transcriptional repressor) of toxin-antitoxin stability system